MKSEKPITPRDRIRIILAIIFSYSIGEGLKLFFGHGVADILKDLSKSPVYQNNIVPFAIASIPFILVVVAVTYSITREQTVGDNTKSQNSKLQDRPYNTADTQSRSKFSDSEKAQLLNELGIIDVTPDLRDSKYSPASSIAATKRHLAFMGILGSKWVDDHSFETFVKRIQLSNGSLRFLLIHPRGKSFATLSELREGHIGTGSLEKFATLCKKYSALRVKLYDDLPVFRLIFIDAQIVAVSRYKLDAAGHFNSKQGWDAPHLEISATPRWTLYETFDEYYNQVWNRSTDLNDYIENNKSNPSLTTKPVKSKQQP